jgi:hypothetical protein
VADASKYIDSDGDELPDLVSAFDDSDDDTSPKNAWIHQPLTAEEQSKRQLERLFEDVWNSTLWNYN